MSLPSDQPPDGIQAQPFLVPPPAAPAEPAAVVLLPARPPHPGFWFGLLWCIAFMVTQVAVQTGVFFVALVVTLVVNTSLRERLLESLRAGLKSRELVATLDLRVPEGISLWFQEAAAIAFAWLLLRVFAGSQWRRRIALARPSVLHLALALLALPGTMILSGLAYALVKHVAPGWTFNYSALVMEIVRKFPVWFALVAFAVGPAIGEELLLRGFVGRGLLARYGVGLGIVLTSLLFGLLHLDPPHVAATAVLGAVLHWVYLNSRSILLPMMLHFLNNALAVLAALDVPPFNESGDDLQPEFWPVYLAAVVLLAVSCWALHASRARIVPGETGWEPSFAGVELPPPASDARVVRVRLGWVGWVVLAALAVFLGVAVHGWDAGLRP